MSQTSISTGFVAGHEPILTLLGGAVGPVLRGDPALDLLLDAVVADGRCGVEADPNIFVAQRVEEACLRCVIGPDSGEAIGLKFHTDRFALRVRFRGCWLRASVPSRF